MELRERKENPPVREMIEAFRQEGGLEEEEEEEEEEERWPLPVRMRE